MTFHVLATLSSYVAVKAGLDMAITSRLTAVCRKIVGHFA